MRRAWVLIALAATGCGATHPGGTGLPMSFAPNRGQFAPDVRFAAQGAGYQLAATDGGLELALGRERVRLAIPGHPRGGAELPGTANYLLGGDPRQWRTNVPTYREVVYPHAWPGIDVGVYGTAGRFEYDLRVSAGADPGAIRLDFGAPAALAEDGSLRIGALRQPPPETYQGGRRVASAYVLNADGTVGFRLGRYDRAQPLVIDPVLTYSAYLGGNGNDSGRAIAVDAAGGAYVTGETQSTNFPAGMPHGGSDAFVVKVAPGGSAVEWSTYVGGDGLEQGNGIALTGDGVIVGGSTTSADFPTAGTPVQTSRHGIRDAFVTKLSPSGTPIWSTYLGGGDADDGNAIAVDPSGNAYIAGTTGSSDFPGTPPNSAAGGDDAFVSKLTAAGALGYSAYVGGDGNDAGAAIAADAGGNAYVAGRAAANLPTSVGPGYQGGGDAFAAKLGPTGAVAYSTYLGGTGDDRAAGVAPAGGGGVVVVGTTQSADFPATPPLHGPSDAFVARLAATGARESAIFLGGGNVDGADAVAVDADGHVVVAGRTLSDDFPTVLPAQPAKGAALDAFVTQLAGTTPLMSTYLGGSGRDEAHGVALDAGGNAYVTGETDGTFPGAGTDPPGNDGYVARLAIGSSTPAPIVTPPPIPPAPQPGPPAPETTITARPPAQTPDQVVRFGFLGRMPGQINPAAGITFGCRVDAGPFTPCTSPYTSAKLALAEHTFEVRAVNASGVADPTPAAFTFRVTQPRPEVRHYACDLDRVGAYHDRGTRDWGPCDMNLVCPRAALCLLDLAVDEHDDSYLFNYDVHLQRFEDGGYKDRVYCFAPPLTTPVNPKLEVRFDPRRGEHNRHHACHADGAFGLVDTSRDVPLRQRCSGSGHAPKPGGDRTTGEGFEDGAHLRCEITATIQRHVTELGDVLSDRPALGPNLLVYTPQAGNVTVTGALSSRARTAATAAKPALKPARVAAKAAGAVRVPLRLNAAAVKLRRRHALSARLRITFRPADGPALSHSRTIRLTRLPAQRRARGGRGSRAR
jgi:hypothetical protein